MKNITNDLIYLGQNNFDERIFEGEIPIKKGMSYNSYLILDNKTVLIDTIEKALVDSFLFDLKKALNGRKLDYLIVQHLEPDHTMAVEEIIKLYPNVKILISMMGLTFLKQFFPSLKFFNNYQIIKEGDSLELDNHRLSFINAPMVHWPEVMLTYDASIKTLFSADAFGSFTVFDELDSKDYIDKEELFNESRRYYTNIVGKYGPQVINVLAKAKKLDIDRICPLHGPIHTELISSFLSYYNLWASYKEEKDGVLIVACSIYGHTLSCAFEMQKLLTKNGIDTELVNLNITNVTDALAKTFIYKKIVLFCPTFNMGLFPKMDEYLSFVVSHNITNKIFGLVENGTWSPNAKKLMIEQLNKLNNIKIIPTFLTIKSNFTLDDVKILEQMILEIEN